MRLSDYKKRLIGRSTRRILVMYWGMFGDLVLTTPLLEALKANFRKARITYLVGRSAHRSHDAGVLLLNNPHVDKYIRSGDSLFADILKERPFDLVLDLVANRTSATVSRLSGAKVRIWGEHRYIPDHFFYSDSLGGAWSEPVRVGIDRRLCRADVNLELARFLGYKGRAVSEPRIYFTDREKREAEGLIARLRGPGRSPVIALHPGGRGHGRLWKTANYSALADALVRRHRARVVIFYGPKEKNVAERLRRLSETRPALAHEEDLRKYAAMLSACDIFISSDGGPLQMALASGAPSIGVFKAETIKNTKYWYGTGRRKGLYPVYVRHPQRPKRSLRAGKLCRRDREEVASVLKEVDALMRRRAS